MKRVIKILKNNIFGLILGILVSSISVYALENIAMIDSEEVTYNNTESHGDYDNVQQTIDELYKKVGFTGEKWTDPTLNGADPVLKEGLIPVIISSKGDTYYANEYTRWYDYSQKRWANAVILVNESKDKYNPGDKIEEQDIESYFVWIPRYKYKVWDTGDYTSAISGDSLANIKEDTGDQYAIRNILGNARVIEIEFESKSVTKQSGTTVDSWLTHPAFTLGNTELNGIWVGKFETGYNQDGENENQITPDSNWTTEGAQKTEEKSNRIIVKPNVYSWRNNTVKNFFMSAYEYKQDLKSHMMKNTEWGAVAYLSHSAYGIGGEININNNSDYKTGYSAAPGTDQSTYKGTGGTETDGKSKAWNTPTGFLGSTTGNITGVYDMSGGAWEYMAAYVEGQVGQSDFDNDTDLKSKYKDYIDQYDKESSTTIYNKRILGDATGEMGPFFTFKDGDNVDRYHNSWYADYSGFVVAYYPWFFRGGGWSDGVLAGQFYFSGTTGGADAGVGFRLVLSISE